MNKIPHKRNLLVVGGSGFLGTHLISFLKSSVDFNIFSVSQHDIDFQNDDSVAMFYDFLIAKNITHLVMLAAIKRQAGDSKEILNSNNKIVDNLLLSLSKYCRPVKILYVSSLAVFGEKNNQYYLSESSSLSPTSFYGEHKMISESKFLQLQDYHCVSIVRPPLIYSHNDSSGYSPGGFYSSAAINKEILLWGDGSELREFLHVFDFCYCIKLLLLRDEFDIINICSGKSYSYLSIALFIQEHLDCKILNRERTGQKVDHQYNPDLIYNTLGGISFISPFHAIMFRHNQLNFA